MLTKANQKQVQTLQAYATIGNTGAVARVLSFMIRASLRKSEQTELKQIAAQFNVANHPEFLI